MSEKSHKGLRKRLKVTGTGKLVARRIGRRHLMSTKPSRRAMRLRTPRVLSRMEQRLLERQYGKLWRAD